MHTLIIIGANHSSSPALDHLIDQAENIHWVEPHPEHAQQREHWASEQTDKNVTLTRAVVTDAVTAGPGNADYQVYNLAQWSGVRVPGLLKRRFPGLRVQQTHNLPTHRATDFVQALQLPQGEKHALYIDQPGEEEAIIGDLAEQNQLRLFTEIHVRATTEMLFKGLAAAQEPVQEKLEQSGLDLVRPPGNLGDLPRGYTHLVATRNVQLARMEDELEQLRTALAQTETRAAGVESENQGLQNALANERLAREKAETGQAELEDLTARLSATEARGTKLEASLYSTNKISKKRKQQLEATNIEREELTTEIETLRARLEQMTQQLDQLQHDSRQQKEARDRLQQSLDNLNQEKDGLRQALATTEQAQKDAETALAASEEDSRSWQHRAEETEANAKKLRTRLAQRAEELEKAETGLTQTKEWLAKRKQQAEDLQNRLNAAEKAAQQASQEKDGLSQLNDSLQQQLENQQQGMTRLQATLERLFSQQQEQFTQAANALGQHVTRQFRQQQSELQSYWGVTRYLETGDTPLEFHQTGLNAEQAGYLVRLIGAQDYDLVIEFGSGASTTFLARTLIKGVQNRFKQRQNGALSKDSEQEVAEYVMPEPGDLPHRLVSFEQTQEQHRRTESELDQAGLSGWVDPVYAPLVPATQSDARLFYDCQSTLSRLADHYRQQTARVLVLVNGPESPTGDAEAKQPALASVLQYFSAHALDLVLTRSDRPGEQAVATQWQQILTERGLAWQEESLGDQALRLSVNTG